MYVIVGSVTTATRLARIFEKTAGFPASVVHTPSALHSGGCSYSVKISERALDTVRMVANEYNVNIKGIYLKDGGEYRDIS